MANAYDDKELVVESEKQIWDAVKAKVKVFVTKDLKKAELPKIKGGGVYAVDSGFPVAGLNPSASAGKFQRWVITEKA